MSKRRWQPQAWGAYKEGDKGGGVRGPRAQLPGEHGMCIAVWANHLVFSAACDEVGLTSTLGKNRVNNESMMRRLHAKERRLLPSERFPGAWPRHWPPPPLPNESFCSQLIKFSACLVVFPAWLYPVAR